jgi:spoIIIJ-associated protein
MEWVETTGKTIEAARESALDQLGVAADEAEFDILEEPRPGLFGRMRGEARLRARVRPTPVRQKQDRRRRSKDKTNDAAASTATDGAGDSAADRTSDDAAAPATDEPVAVMSDEAPDETAATTSRSSRNDQRAPRKRRAPRPTKADDERSAVAADEAPARPSRAADHGEEPTMTTDEQTEPTVSPDEVGAAAVQFMEGLATAFGVAGTATLEVNDLELDVAVAGSDLGLLVGPGGRTLNAIQDLARVAAQRRLGDHDTRLRIDVAGYRTRREAALSSFARDVAEQVRASGTARALEPMVSADRKVVHDALNDEPGVVSRSVGDDPDRRIVVEPA